MICFRGTTNKDLDRRQSRIIDKKLQRESKLMKNNVRILFLGTTDSGKTTFFKQMKIINLNGFTAEERLAKKAEIYDNVHTAIHTLILNLRKFEIQLYPMAFKCSTEIGRYAPDKITSEYVENIRIVWNDSGIQKLYEQRSKFHLIDNAKYFLDRLDVIFADHYVPTNSDILRSRTTTHCVDELKISVNDHGYKYNLSFVDIGGCARTKWVQVFEGVSIVLFMVACSAFDELDPHTNENSLFGSMDLFRSIWHNKFLRSSDVIIYLNKIDLLEEKLARGKIIAKYFFDYTNFDCKYGHGESVLEVSKNFIRYKFEKIASESIPNESLFDRKSIARECKFHFLVATNTDECRETYEKCKQTIIMRALKIFELN